MPSSNSQDSLDTIKTEVPSPGLISTFVYSKLSSSVPHPKDLEFSISTYIYHMQTPMIGTAQDAFVESKILAPMDSDQYDSALPTSKPCPELLKVNLAEIS